MTSIFNRLCDDAKNWVAAARDGAIAAADRILDASITDEQRQARREVVERIDAIVSAIGIALILLTFVDVVYGVTQNKPFHVLVSLVSGFVILHDVTKVSKRVRDMATSHWADLRFTATVEVRAGVAGVRTQDGVNRVAFTELTKDTLVAKHFVHFV